MNLGEKLGRHLRALRSQQGLTLEQLADRSGIPAESLSRFERGRTVPSLKTLERVATGLGLALPDLVSFGTLPAVVEGLAPEARGLALLVGKESPETMRKIRRHVELIIELEREEAT